MGPKPLWVWRYQQKAHCLRSLYPGFRHMEPGYISSDAYVELHSMDFGTGHTDPSFTQFFAPDTDTQIRIDNTTLNPEDPLDDPFTWARMTKENDDTFGSDDMHHSLHAAFSKYIRKSPHGNKPLLWDPVP